MEVKDWRWNVEWHKNLLVSKKMYKKDSQEDTMCH